MALDPDLDWQLLKRAARDGSALEQLFVRNRDYVYRLAWGFCGSPDMAEDAVQEVFLRLGGAGLRWRVAARFRTWLYRVTLNVCRELRRKAARGREAPHGSTRATVGDAGLITELQQALDTLPDRQREVVVLRFLQGLSTAETARVMGLRQGTVKAHLHRATHALRGGDGP